MNLEAILLLLQTALPPLINLAESIFSKHGSGATKKAVVTAQAQAIIRPTVAASQSIGQTGWIPVPDEFVGGVIEEMLAAMKASGAITAPPLPAGLVPPVVTMDAANPAALSKLKTGVTFEGGGSSPGTPR